MNKEAIRLWAEALESGAYAEVPYPMHGPKGFDRMGVLVEAYRKNVDWTADWVEGKCWCADLANKFEPRLEYLGSAFWPPEAVLKWLDLKCTERCRGECKPPCEVGRFTEILETGIAFAEVAKRLRVFISSSNAS